MRAIKVGLLLLWVFALTAQAELSFPALSGRVVDNAQLIEPATRAQLTQELQAHEQATGEQLVVVTLAARTMEAADARMPYYYDG